MTFPTHSLAKNAAKLAPPSARATLTIIIERIGASCEQRKLFAASEQIVVSRKRKKRRINECKLQQPKIETNNHCNKNQNCVDLLQKKVTLLLIVFLGLVLLLVFW